MIKKTQFIVALGAAIFSLSACNPAEQYKTELATIDSCISVIEEMEVQHDGIEFDSLKLMVEHVIDNEKAIKDLYTPDTLDMEFGKLMNDAKTVRKKLGSVGKEQVAYSDELNAIKHQFLDLKEDILNGLYDDQQIKDYINVEKAALNKVSLGFSSFYSMQKEEKKRYYYATPKIDAFILELKK